MKSDFDSDPDSEVSRSQSVSVSWSNRLGSIQLPAGNDVNRSGRFWDPLPSNG
jgi:hypothetical protein